MASILCGSCCVGSARLDGTGLLRVEKDALLEVELKVLTTRACQGEAGVDVGGVFKRKDRLQSHLIVKRRLTGLNDFNRHLNALDCLAISAYEEGTSEAEVARSSYSDGVESY